MVDRSMITQLAGFFLKDVRICRQFLLIYLPVFCALGAGIYTATPLYLPFAILVTTMTAAAVAIVDDYFNALSLFCSLPLSRRRVVYGRYFSSCLILLAGAALSFAYGRLLAAVMGPGDVSSPTGAGMLTIEGLAPFIGIAAALLAAFLPFYFRFGALKGGIVFCSAVVILALLFVGVRELYAPLDEAVLRAGNVWFALLDGVAVVRSALSGGLFIAAGLALLAVFTALSVHLSRRFFLKREL